MTTPPGTPRPALRNRLFGGLTGRRGVDVSGQPGDLLGQLRAVGGSSSRTRSGIDLSAAAARLGVSRRTVERWVVAAATGTGQQPSAGSSKRLTDQARRMASTRAGRRAALQPARARLAGPANIRVKVAGVQGPPSGKRGYLRQRETQLDLDPAAAAAMLDAYEQGGDQGFMAWATDAWDQRYLNDWTFDTVDTLTVQTQDSRGRWSDL